MISATAEAVASLKYSSITNTPAISPLKYSSPVARLLPNQVWGKVLSVRGSVEF